MISIRQSAKLLVTTAAILMAATSFAGFWDWSTPYQGPDKDIITLVITANYKKPLLMAQLIQNENRQPFILLPNSKEKKIFFWPAGKKNPAIEIKEKNLGRFISFLNPQQIIVLGDKRYVSAKYLNMINKNLTVVVIKNRDWIKASEVVQKMLNLNNLYRDYSRMYQKLQSDDLYVPTKKKSQPAAEVKVQESEEIDILEPQPVDSGNNNEKISQPEIKNPNKTGPVLVEE